MRALSLAVRRILVIDDQPEIHADFRKILCPPDAPAGLHTAKARLFGDAPPPERFALRCALDSALQGEEGARLVARAFTEGAPYQLAFVDMRMPPGWSGLETIRALWEADANLQVVLCTAYSDDALDDVTAALGRPDKLLVLKKPFEPIEVQQLAAALSEKWRAEREAELKLEELERIVDDRTRDVQHAATHDKLTNLANRALVLDRIAGCLDMARRDPSRHFALLFVDIDGFKSVNDSLGHAAGDRLLIQIAERIRGLLRDRDLMAPATLPARLGGDEFLVLLENLRQAPDAARVAERLVAELAVAYDLDGTRVEVTASIGVATSDRQPASASQMLREADIAMYRAKSRGRSRYVMFDEAMDREVARRLRVEAMLRGAVANDALALHYQPIVRLEDGHIEGFEALVRGTGELAGASAADLVAAAEDTGLIQKLGLQLLARACTQLAAWHRELPAAAGLRMSVNLSRRQLVDSEFSSRVAETIRSSGVDATRLSLEITETSVLHDLDGAIAVLRRLRGLGAEVVLDDFGSGYSAIAHLHRMPLTGMKIDGGFLTLAEGEPRHAAALRAMVAIAQAFDLDIVAEGIETQEHLALVRSLGIARGQGYLYARAVPASEATAMLTRGRTLAPKG